MQVLVALSLFAFAACFCLTSLTRRVAIHFALVDHPDTTRKFHRGPIPRIGGLPIALTYGLTIAIALGLQQVFGRIHIQHLETVRSLLPATAVIFLTGFLDDLRSLRPWQKLLGQLAGATLAVKSGTVLTLGTVSGLPIHSFWASHSLNLCLSIAWLIGCSNAVNLIDGLDGLAAGVGAFATGTALVFSLLTGNAGLALATMPLLACLLAFLCFNFNPASIFLGDCGSLTIGFMLGCFALIWYRHSTDLMSLIAPLMVLSLPLLDVALAVVRRFLRRVPIFGADRGHIHHKMLARGFTPARTALSLYAACLLAALLALVQTMSHRYLRVGASIAFVALVFGAIRYLDYVELEATLRTFSRRKLLALVRDEILMHEMERDLESAQSEVECWDRVQHIGNALGFPNMCLQLRGVYFERAVIAIPVEEEWKIVLPLASTGYLTLTCRGQERSRHSDLAMLDRMREALALREKQWNLRSMNANATPLKRIA